MRGNYAKIYRFGKLITHMQKKSVCLDIESLIESGFYGQSERITWHCSQNKYFALYEDLFELLKNIDLDRKDEEIFNIAFPLILKDVSVFFSHLIDYEILKGMDITPSYSKNNFYFDFIWNGIEQKQVFSIFIEKQRIAKLRFISKIKAFINKNILSYFSDTFIYNKNKLASKYYEQKKIRLVDLSFETYFKKGHSCESINVEVLTSKLSKEVSSYFESKYFDLKDIYISYLDSIFKSVLSKTINDIVLFRGFPKNLRTLVTGTGHNYINRLFTFLGKKYGHKTIRFDHGGERFLFNDPHFWFFELYGIDKYVTFSLTHKNAINSIVSEIQIPRIAIDFIETKKRRKNNKSTFSIKDKNLLFVSSAFVGEKRQLEDLTKLVDVVLFDFQKYLIEQIQSLGYKVYYKKHPKGKSFGHNFLINISDDQIDGNFIKAAMHFDVLIFVSAGSAFFDSLELNKKIILIDSGREIRSLNQIRNYENLRIVTTLWRDNIPYIDKSELLRAINE